MVKNEIDSSKFRKFNTVFNPKHIAFIGASESSTFGAMLYLKAFKESKYSDTFYPINPKREEIMGWKCYPSVLKVPYPIDTAYISLKTQFIPQVIEDNHLEYFPLCLFYFFPSRDIISLYKSSICCAFSSDLTLETVRPITRATAEYELPSNHNCLIISRLL